MICQRMSKNTPYDAKELLSVAYEGYAHACKNFDDTNGARFKTYAEYRVTGSIRDYFRAMSPLKRNVTKRPMPAFISYDEVIDPYNDKQHGLNEVLMATSCEDFIPDIKQYEILKKHLSGLPERDRKIIDQYYFQDMRMYEIADGMGFTESRISQLHTKIIEKIRRKQGLKINYSRLNHMRIPAEEIDGKAQVISEAPSIKEAAKRIGVSVATLYNWRKDHPVIREALLAKYNTPEPSSIPEKPAPEANPKGELPKPANNISEESTSQIIPGIIGDPTSGTVEIVIKITCGMAQLPGIMKQIGGVA